jgi:hypothetical protein
VVVALITFFFNAVVISSVALILQYVSVRYNWTISEAGFLLSLRAGISIILFTVVLPLLTRLLLMHGQFSGLNKDLLLAKGSIILLAVGYIALALAPSASSAMCGVILTALGTGFPSLMRSLVTSIIEPQRVVQLYALITMFEMLGYLVSGPVLAALFKIGLALAGWGVGLPFLVSGGLMAVGAVLVFTMRLSHT